ncbi:MAG: hypothetical protein GXO39_03570 [Thermotogae bacterium]|nr:hypothetical protein [Thermotogota bacterium]
MGGNVRDVELGSLIKGFSLKDSVLRIDCPKMDAPLVIFIKDRQVVSVFYRDIPVKNLLEMLDILTLAFYCEDATFSLEAPDYENPSVREGFKESFFMDPQHLVIWVASFKDELSKVSEDLLGSLKNKRIRMLPEKAKDVKGDLEASFLLMAVAPLMRGTTLEELYSQLPISERSVNLFVEKLLKMGVLVVDEGEIKESRGEVVVLMEGLDPDLEKTVFESLKGMGLSPKKVSRKRKLPNADLYIVDIGGKGFLWANSVYGTRADRTILIGSEDIRPSRFLYLKKPVSVSDLSKAIGTLLLTHP